MKIWAATRDDNRILTESVMEFETIQEGTAEEWSAVIGELCRALDLSRPVLLKKHKNDLNNFRHTAFTAADFMEPISFKKLTIELFPDKKPGEG